MDTEPRAGRNRTVVLSEGEMDALRDDLVRVRGAVSLDEVEGRVIWQDVFEVAPCLPTGSVDLLFLDPPYNLTKAFGSEVFREQPAEEYEAWIESWFRPLLRALKPTGSVYWCSEWRSSPVVHAVLSRYLKIRNRITWEREKGRGSERNWKNSSEDIWYATVSDDFTFNVEAVKLKRKVLAPYTDGDRTPRDWMEGAEGRYRLTYPSNLWTDITVPFWSMPENTAHPTQKPEKLLAKVILASTDPGDVVFDPFLGSGTACVVARKLGRRFLGIELDLRYCCLAAKRLRLAETDRSIQGYAGDVFWERNSNRDRARCSG